MKFRWTKVIDKRYKHKKVQAFNETWVMEADAKMKTIPIPYQDGFPS